MIQTLHSILYCSVYSKDLQNCPKIQFEFSTPFSPLSSLLSVQVVDSDLYRPPVSLELLDLGQLHDSAADIPQALGCQVRASDVLLERAQVNARVLLGKAIGS